MTKEELALLLNGRRRREEITTREEELAKENGLVVCFGASDDLTEFRGSLYDEKGNFDGGKVYFKGGDIANGDHINDDDLDYSVLEKLPFIDAVWCPKNENGEIVASWAFKTDIPHATFDVFDENELYCKGVVFDFSSII